MHHQSALEPSAGSACPCVDIYGPRGLRRFLRVALELSSSQLLFQYAVHELEPSDEQCPAEGRLSPALTASSDTLHPQERPGTSVHLDPHTDCYHLIDDKQFVVKAFQLYHRVPSFGFSVQERERPGRLNTELLKELGTLLQAKSLISRRGKADSFTIICNWLIYCLAVYFKIYTHYRYNEPGVTWGKFSFNFIFKSSAQ